MRRALLGSASTVMVAILLPGTAAAQATSCSQTGTTVTCVDGTATVLTGTASTGTSTVSGPGLVASNATTPLTIGYTATGPIATTGVSAVNLTSTAGALTFTPNATTAPVNVSTTGGINADGVIINATGQAATVTVGNVGTTGATSFGVRVNGATDLTLRTGDITTTGAGSRGIQASTATGNVNLVAGNINTTDRGVTTASGLASNNTTVVGNVTSGAAGVLASGGNVAVTTGNVVAANGFGVVGQALTGSVGNVVVRTGTVTATNGNGISANVFNATGSADIGCSSVTNTAAGNSAIFSQTVGGNITINCGAVTSTGNSAVAANSQGGNILINVASATNNNFSAIYATNTTGSITTNGGVITTSAPTGAGITLINGTGAVDVGYTSITSTGADGYGVTVNSTGAANFRGGTITTTGINAIGVRIDSSGATGTIGNITQTGANSRGLIFNTAGTGAAVNLTLGNVSSTNDAVLINNGAAPITLVTGTVRTSEADAPAITLASTGTIALTSGAITATGANSDGVVINGGAGAVTAVVAAANAANNAILVTSTGTQSITANGVTTGTLGSGIASNTTGARTIVVGTGGNVTGGTQAILLANTGGASVTNSGIVGATSAGLAINAATATSPVTVTNNPGATINGRLVTGTWADVVANAGTINTQGLSDFGTGTDTLTNSGTFNTTAATTLTGLEALNNSGTLNANFGLTFDAGATALTNTGTLNAAGTIDFGAGADSFANTGAGVLNLTANAALAGLETFTQSGRINLNTFTLTGPAIALNNSGTIDTSGSAGLAGFTSLSNSGTIDLAPGVFTAPAGAFTNSGTILADEGASTITGQSGFTNTGTIDLQDGAADDVLTIVGPYTGTGGSLLVDYSGVASDRLVITGLASGATVINVTPTNGLVVNSTGVLVVDTGTSAGTQFTLGSTTGNGLIDLSLLKVGQDYFLASAPNVNAFDPLVLSNISTDIWYQSADVYGAYAAQRRSDLGGDPSQRLGLWGQLYLGREKYGDTRTQSVFGNDTAINSRIETKRYGGQVGVDYNFGMGVLGVTGGYERAKADLKATIGGMDVKGYNVGLYGIVGADTGFYAGALVKYDRGKAEIKNLAFTGLGKLSVKSWGAEGEAGYRMAFGTSRLDLGAGLAWVNSKIEDFTASNIGYDFDKARSLRGRVGARFEGGTNYGPYVDLKLLHEFRDSNDVTLLSGTSLDTLETEGRGTWGRAELGFGAHHGSGPMAALWGEYGDVKGFGVRAGWRFGGGAAMLPPAPPLAPPPPPAPPATQTCYDGSVILATDVCPSPPPPPPPPAPPEPAPERG